MISLLIYKRQLGLVWYVHYMRTTCHMFCIHSHYLNLAVPFLFPFTSSSSLEKNDGGDTLLLSVLWDVYPWLKKQILRICLSIPLKLSRHFNLFVIVKKKNILSGFSRINNLFFFLSLPPTIVHNIGFV